MAPSAAVGDDLSAQWSAVAGYAAENPLVAALAVLGLALAVAAVVAAVRRRRRTAADRLVRALAARDAVSVLMHPNPDPDAMASALAVDRLAQSVDTEATLQYPGQIRHQENRVFQNVLDLDLERIEHVNDLATDAVVLVDHNEPRGFDGAGSVRAYAIVDHHPGEGEGEVFTDVRPEYGSCATVLSEYLYDLGYEPDGDDRALGSNLATALLYGIQSDTDGLTRGYTSADFAAGAYLSDAVDSETLDRIANPQVDAEVLEVKSRAVMDREVDGPYVVSDVGSVSNVDAIAQAADELLQLEGATAVVVLGDRDGRLHVSGRSRDDRVHMGRVLHAAVEEIPMAQAGGHARMGGCQLSLDHMNGLGPGEGLSRQEFRQRLFDAMAGEIQ